MSNKHAVKEAPASYQSTPVPSVNQELQSFITGNPLTENLNLWISATKAKSTSGRGTNKKIELVGIKKLRELILELAVRGKLVPQNPEDEPASELLKKIDAEKAKLIAEGKIKKQKKLPEISEDEKPFELPSGWEWARVGELGATSTGKTPSTTKPEFFNGKIPFIGPGQISQAGYISKPEKYLTEAGSIHSSEASTGDIISVCIGGSIGKSAIVKNRITFNQQINCISPIKINSTYLYHAISTDLFLRIILENSSGSATPIINRSKWDNLLIPVPPLAEQHRIVAKVDELMVLCDQLEQHSEHQLDAHKQLVETLLATLIESKNADELATNWQRLAEHFDTLFSGALTSTTGIGNGGGEWAIDRLKDTILQLAVMGKLVPQNPDDEPASELLKKIDAEKAKLVKEGKIKKQKPLPTITDEEKPFELPDGWEWGHLDELTLQSEAGWSPKCDGTPRENNDWGVLKVSAVTWGKFKPEENKALPTHLAPKPEYEIKPDDFLISRANTAELVARSVIVQDGAPKRLMMSDKIIRFRFSKNIYTAYLNMFNNCIFARDYYLQVAGGTSSSMKNVSRLQIQQLAVPLPPLAEQHRIVAKVDELFALCDQLKARLQAASETQLTLTEALVEQALN